MKKRLGKKRMILAIVDIILIAFTLAFIFGNSMMDVQESTKASESVTDIVIESIPPLKDAVEQDKISYKSLESVTRSLAHILEFFLLGAEIMALLLIIRATPMSAHILFALSVCLTVCVTDELLQQFTDRSTEFIDVVKDFSGILLGFAAVLGIYAISRKLTKNISKQTDTESK